MSDVKRTLVNEIHAPARVNFLRRKYHVKGIGEFLQADLISMLDFKKFNNQYGYILIIIDVFSKQAFAYPLKTKKGEEVSRAILKFLKSYKYVKRIKLLQVDEGGEFWCRAVLNLLKRYNIHMYSVHSKIKCACAERVIRTLKNWMYKEFNYRGSWRWIDFIQSLLDKYNNSKHRTIGMAPASVNKRNEKSILLNKYNNNMKIMQPTDLKLLDYVRISDVSGMTFRRGFQPSWSPAIYQIVEVKKTFPVTFRIRETWGEKMVLDKGFYRQELQKVKYKDQYLIEKVVKKRGNKIKVRWLGFDKRFDSYIDESRE